MPSKAWYSLVEKSVGTRKYFKTTRPLCWRKVISLQLGLSLQAQRNVAKIFFIKATQLLVLSLEMKKKVSKTLNGTYPINFREIKFRNFANICYFLEIKTHENV